MNYNESIFMNSNPNIIGNEELREPQVNAYIEIFKHFVQDQKKTHALVVLPTGVGKTGLMGMMPYFIANGRVLIITPQLTIKDSVLNSLDPDKADNFWLKRKIFDSPSQLPIVVEYSNDLPNEVLNVTNIVILNVHKLQKRLEKSPLNKLSKDFFDMIIIDEAHHSTAKSWVDTIQHFDNAKVVKLTGTPFRTDKQELVGELVYRYSLGNAMACKYVKSLENITYVPDELLLTIDQKDDRYYTVEELYSLGLKDEDWVARSVAYSRECSQSVVRKSIELLNNKLKNSPNVPHKIIAVACSIYHAEQIKELYEGEGIATTILHSELDDLQKARAYSDIKTNKVKAVINVAMLGEGYDHKYLSIAAIFRPFKAELPYVQFVGRILRIIPEDKVQSASDNIGQIIAHESLGMKDLWDKYKKEIEESEIIKYLKGQDIEDEEDNSNKESKSSDSQRETEYFGNVKEVGNGQLNSSAYITTELMTRYKQETEEFKKRVKEIQGILGCSQEQAEQMVRMAEGENNTIKRPDIYFRRTRKDIDKRIRFEIVPGLISKHQIDKAGIELKNLPIFERKFSWIRKNGKNNAAMLAQYFNAYLKNELGNSRDEWTIDDYVLANAKLDELTEFVDAILDK